MWAQSSLPNHQIQFRGLSNPKRGVSRLSWSLYYPDISPNDGDLCLKHVWGKISSFPRADINHLQPLIIYDGWGSICRLGLQDIYVRRCSFALMLVNIILIIILVNLLWLAICIWLLKSGQASGEGILRALQPLRGFVAQSSNIP